MFGNTIWLEIKLKLALKMGFENKVCSMLREQIYTFTHASWMTGWCVLQGDLPTYWLIFKSIPQRHTQTNIKTDTHSDWNTLEPESRPKELGFPEILHTDTELHTWQKPQKEVHQRNEKERENKHQMFLISILSVKN